MTAVIPQLARPAPGEVPPRTLSRRQAQSPGATAQTAHPRATPRALLHWNGSEGSWLSESSRAQAQKQETPWLFGFLAAFQKLLRPSNGFLRFAKKCVPIVGRPVLKEHSLENSVSVCSEKPSPQRTQGHRDLKDEPKRRPHLPSAFMRLHQARHADSPRQAPGQG